MYHRRPSAVTALAVFHLVIGGLGLLMTLLIGLIALLQSANSNPGVNIWNPGAPHPVYVMEQALDRDLPARHVLNLLSHVSSLVGFAMLVIAGAGLLHQRRWAWWLSLVYCLWNVLHTILFLVFHFGLILPAMDAFINKNHPPGMLTPEGFAVSWYRSVYVMQTVMMALAGAYPIVVAIFLCLPAVNAAFRTDSDLPPVGWEERGDSRPRRDDHRREDEERRRYDERRYDDRDDDDRRRYDEEDDDRRRYDDHDRRRPRRWD
jgi:hypothetical protein